MEFRYQANFADNYHGVLLGFWGSRAAAVRHGLMCLGFGAVVFWGLWLMRLPPAWSMLLALCAAVAWGAIFTVGFGAWLAAALTRRQRAIGAARIVVTDEGLERITRSASATQSWDGISRIVETSRAFLMYDAVHPVFAIEKSAVGTAGELAALRQFLAERMECRAAKVPTRELT